MKVILIVACDNVGVIIGHVVPKGKIANAVYYRCHWATLCYSLRRKWSHLQWNPPFKLHNNVYYHVAESVTTLLNRWDWDVLEHLHLHDIKTYDFNLFPLFIKPLRGIRLLDIAEVFQAVGRTITLINRNYLAVTIQRLPVICQSVQEFTVKLVTAYVATSSLQSSCHFWNDLLKNMYNNNCIRKN